MIIGSYVSRIHESYVEIRLVTDIEGSRRVERMKKSFHLIPKEALLFLANQMIGSYANFTEQNLKESDANISFERNSGRRLKFTFRQGCQIRFFVKFALSQLSQSNLQPYIQTVRNENLV